LPAKSGNILDRLAIDDAGHFQRGIDRAALDSKVLHGGKQVAGYARAREHLARRLVTQESAFGGDDENHRQQRRHETRNRLEKNGDRKTLFDRAHGADGTVRSLTKL
jgi:hypothetical protein